jgi:hypothetical protein
VRPPAPPLREERDPEACAIEPLDAERQDLAVESARQHSKRGAVTRRAAKERTGMPSFIFWSASNARCVLRRRRRRPFGIIRRDRCGTARSCGPVSGLLALRQICATVRTDSHGIRGRIDRQLAMLA